MLNLDPIIDVLWGVLIALSVLILVVGWAQVMVSKVPREPRATCAHPASHHIVNLEMDIYHDTLDLEARDHVRDCTAPFRSTLDHDRSAKE